MGEKLGDPFHQFGDPGAEGAVHRSVEVAVPALVEAVKPLGQTMPLSDALALAGAVEKPLTLQDRETIADQALRAMDQIYCHLYLKRARHAFDPVAALARLRRYCSHFKTDLEFHEEISLIFKRLHDIHTGYILPPPYDSMVAFLPFTLTRCCADPDKPEDRHVIVSGVLNGFKHDTFRPGVRVVGWNGTPIDRAIDKVGDLQQGANPAARMAFGTLLMTIRWLGGSMPPEELWVTVAFHDQEDKLHEVRFPWRVMLLPDSKDPLAQAFPPLLALSELNTNLSHLNSNKPVSVDRKAITGRSVARLLYRDPETGEIPEDMRPSAGGGAVAKGDDQILSRKRIPNKHEGTFVAEIITCQIDGKPVMFGRVHLHHFVFPGTEAYLEEFLKVLAQMPETALVIDIRGNGGGEIPTAERLLQTLTKKTIRPLPFQFRATPTVADIVSSKTFETDSGEMSTWPSRVNPLIDDAAQFSLNGTMTDPETLRDTAKEQRYSGQVVLLTDAMTYSAGDMFAASFQDHNVGTIVGVDPRTGGGGANVWFHGTTVHFADNDAMFQHLPGNVQMHYSVRRCLRIGSKNAGLPFEEDGVEPDILRPLSETDLTHHGRDMLLYVARTFFAPDKGK
ncbi:MAG: S41 family peptidase [Pseudomonadota bacterium]